MSRPLLFVATASVCLAFGCVADHSEPNEAGQLRRATVRASPTTSAPRFAAPLPDGVTRTPSPWADGEEVQAGSGGLSFAPPWPEAVTIDYRVIGAPSELPRSYGLLAGARGSDRQLSVTMDVEWSDLRIDVGSGQVHLAHNPDGTFSMDGVVHETRAALVDALVSEARLQPLTEALAVTWAMAIDDALTAGLTRGLMDCGNTLVGPSLPAEYACRRWGQTRPACAYLQARTSPSCSG